MDALDRAQQATELHLNAALERQKQKTAGLDVGTEHCVECGAFIPQARRDAVHNCTLCIDCAELHEQQAKHYRK